MFGLKSRKEKKALHDAAMQKQIAAINESVARAENCADPGEKLIMLDKLAENLKDQYKSLILDRDFSLAGTASLFGHIFGFVAGAAGTGVATGLGLAKAATLLAVTLPNIAIAPIVAAGILGGVGVWKLLGKVEPKIEKADYEKNKELYTTLDESRKKVARLTEEVMALDLKAFASSKVFDTLYDRYPSLKDRFVKEAFRQTSTPAVAPPVSPPEMPNNKTGFKV